MSSGISNPHDPKDGGRWGENHSPLPDGGQHNVLYRGDSHISWDTNKNGDYKHGSGHTFENQGQKIIPWDR